MKAFLLLAVLSAFQTAQAAQLDTKSLNSQLTTTHASWVAKDTPISQLTLAEQKRMLGLNRAAHPDTEFIDSYGFTRANLPTKLDWRNKDGANWISPILNQANCGSCVAFASIGVLESQVNIASGIPNTHVRLSPQNLFSCGGGSCDYGWVPQSAASFLQSKGVPDEACMPYVAGATGQDVACNAACADSASRTIKIKSFSAPTRSLRNLDSVKAALQKGPVVTTLSVYADFLNYSTGVYKHVTGDELGGHAISIIGYDDDQQAWIIRNSWGPDWGDRGFGLVSYDDVSGVSDETWSYALPTGDGAVSLEAPLDYSYVTGSMTVLASSTYKGTSSLSASITNKAGVASHSHTWNANANPTIDVSSMTDGRYDMQVTAKDALGHTLGTSTRHLFYVANTQPTLSVTYIGKDVDLSTDLTDRIELNIEATSSSVPMSSLVFHFKGTDGVEHTRTANIVLDQMTMGWRTNLVPNGKYEIWFTGHLDTNAFNLQTESAHLTVTTKN